MILLLFTFFIIATIYNSYTFVITYYRYKHYSVCK